MTREEFKMWTFGIRYGYPQTERSRRAWAILAAWPR